jgi:hypothetical protein
MPFQPAAQGPEAEQLVVIEHACRPVQGVQQRGSVALGKDQPVVARVARRGEVVSQVLGQQHRHQVGRRHRGRRVPGPGCGRGVHRVRPELLPQVTKLFGIHVARHYHGAAVSF